METISNFNFRSFQLHANFTLDQEHITRRNYVTYSQNWRGGDPPLTVKLYIEPSKWPDFFAFTPSYGGKEPQRKFLFGLYRV